MKQFYGYKDIQKNIFRAVPVNAPKELEENAVVSRPILSEYSSWKWENLRPHKCDPVDILNSEVQTYFMGGNFTPEFMLGAYYQSFFAWPFSYTDQDFSENKNTVKIWFSPYSRYLIFPEFFHVSKRLRRFDRHSSYQYTFNRHFTNLLTLCQNYWEKNGGTWILDEMFDAYLELHRRGFAVSVEVWEDGALAGGLYGFILGRIFIGESMVSLKPQVSKLAFVRLMEILIPQGLVFADAQIHSNHMQEFGALYFNRKDYLNLLDQFGHCQNMSLPSE